MSGRRTAAITIPTSDIRPMDFVLHCRPNDGSEKDGHFMKIARLADAVPCPGLRIICRACSGQACAKGCAALFCLAAERHGHQGRVLVPASGLRNMGVTHAGHDFPNSGHHHLLIDVNEPLDPNQPIPQDKAHLHFGAGQTEARIELPPGKHTLQLVLGDAGHYPFNPPVVSEKITVTIR